MCEILVHLSTKEQQILSILSKRKDPIKAQDLATAVGSSTRYIYYSLKNISTLFGQLGINGSIQTSNGILLDEAQKFKAIEFMGTNAAQYNRNERVAYIICASICADWKLRLQKLQEKFGLSRNAIFRDLMCAKKDLSEFNLRLCNSKKNGYYINGDMLLIRTVFQKNISYLLNSSMGKSLDLFDENRINEYFKKVKRITNQLSIELSSEKMYELVYILLMVIKVPNDSSIQNVDMEIIQQSREYRIVNEVFAELGTYEKNYLTISLLNLGTGNVLEGKMNEDLELWQCAKKIIDLFEIIACVNFDKKEELMHAIFMHMRLSCYNYRNKVPHVNLLSDKIQTSYADVYHMTETCCNRMVGDFPYPVDENEIAYLTLHFETGLESATKKAKVAHVLLACPYVTTGTRLLKTVIEKQFDNIVIESSIPSNKVNYYPFGEKIDFVISTISFDCRYPLIRVQQILTEEDIANIATLMMLLDINSKTDSLQFKILLEIVRQNVDDETYSRICKNLNRYINTEGTLLNMPSNKQPNLFNTLGYKNIRFVEEQHSDWENEIRVSSNPLLAANEVSPNYVDKIIEMGKLHGPYFVIDDYTAIAHVRPQEGAYDLGITLSIYREGLDILQKKGIRFLFVLASPNQREHLHILENIMEFSNDRETREKLLKASSTHQALELLRKYE